MSWFEIGAAFALSAFRSGRRGTRLAARRRLRDPTVRQPAPETAVRRDPTLGVRPAICDDIAMSDAADPRERLRAAVGLADLIGETCALADDRGLLRGSCPAHPDGSRSLYVARDGSFYHCFSCGRHGDAVRWTMYREEVDEPRALSLLAERMGDAEALPSSAAP